jgi:hypothetical protein
VGLEVKEQGENCVLFEGGGGHVFFRACEKYGGMEVELETREWDCQVKQFMRKV